MLNIDLFLKKRKISGGDSNINNPTDIITSLNIKKNNELYFADKNDHIVFNIDKDSLYQNINGSYYSFKGTNQVVYKISNENIHYKLVIKLISKNIDLYPPYNNYIQKFGEKYKNDCNIDPTIKKFLPDILYYGLLNIKNDVIYYIITPEYKFDFYNLEYNSLIKISLDLIKILKILLDKRIFLNDLKYENIGYFENINYEIDIILIDYDLLTLNKDFTCMNSLIPNYLVKEFIDLCENPRVTSTYKFLSDVYENFDKFYNVSLCEIFYILFYRNQPYFNTLLEYPNIYSNTRISFMVLKNLNTNLVEFEKIHEKCKTYNNTFDLFYNYNNRKGLLSNDEEHSLSLNEIEDIINNIKEYEVKSYILNKKIINNLKLYYQNSTIDKTIMNLGIYGFQLHNFNIKSNKFKFYSMHEDKAKMIRHYINYNNWDIIHYDNDNDKRINDNTLKYALQTVGCINSVSFKKRIPYFTLHINDQFIELYGGCYDNCRLMEKDNLFVYIWWTINITDIFNIMTVLHNDKINTLPDKIYINVVDHPIHREDGKHPFRHFRKGYTKILIPITCKPDKQYPIYCWPSKKKYKDIPLPYHDIMMFLLGREFCANFNVLNYNNQIKKFENKSINKALFRGSFTNCNLDILKSPRIKLHIKSLQNPKFIDAVVTPGWNYVNYEHYQLKNSDNIDKLLDIKQYLSVENQLDYKYILNVDGFASPFRTHKELYIQSCIIMPDSEFTDVIRNILKPWVNYIPCNKDYSNLVNTIKWCIKNNDEILKIIDNNIKLIKYLSSIKLYVAYTFNVLILGLSESYHLDKLFKIKYNEIKIPTIKHDKINTLGKKGEIIFNNLINNKEKRVTVNYGGGKDSLINSENLYYPIKISKNKPWEYINKNNMKIINNTWGIPLNGTGKTLIFLTDKSFGFAWDIINNKSGQVVSYPEIGYGWSPNSNSWFVKEEELYLINANKNYNINVLLNKDDNINGIWNICFDIWISPTKFSKKIEDSQIIEIMIWLDYENQKPLGIFKETIFMENKSWDVYIYDNNNNNDNNDNITWRVVSFLANEKICKLKNFNLTNYINYINEFIYDINNYYVNTIEFGCEICGGKGFLEVLEYKLSIL